MKRVHIIYMAAGNSRRFGNDNKLLAEYDGKPLFRHGLDTVLALSGHGLDDVLLSLTVVTQYKEIFDYIPQYAILSPESVDGASFTIRNGINHAIKEYGECDYYMFMVADQPDISRDTISRLINAADGESMTYAIAFGERRGNPCLFHASLVPELLMLKGDEGGSVLMKKYKPHLVLIQDETELNDIDVISDFLKNA